ncbi:LOW QUALITY PROTEIN: hypothetical protein HZS_7544 [Henneguya salminicola]|nr:LOW QUALITY PROTEIN: hypothetical protein HZS_7544 [Henneguya salminicola]
MDVMISHNDMTVRLNSSGANVPIIPCWLTSKLQPLDPTINFSFKCSVASEWENWMCQGSKSFIPTGRIKNGFLCSWVLCAWKQVSAKIIENAFNRIESESDVKENENN